MDGRNLEGDCQVQLLKFVIDRILFTERGKELLGVIQPSMQFIHFWGGLVERVVELGDLRLRMSRLDIGICSSRKKFGMLF